MENKRRKFIQQTGLIVASATFLPKALLSATGHQKQKLGIALVGLGYYITILLASALQYTKHRELKAIVTGSPEKIPFQKKYGIPDKNIYD